MSKKCLLVFIAMAVVFSLPGMAFAVQDPSSPPTPAYKGNIISNQFNLKSNTVNPNWSESTEGFIIGVEKNPGNKYVDQGGTIDIVNSLNNGKAKNWRYYEQGNPNNPSKAAGTANPDAFILPDGFAGSDPSVGGVYYSTHPYGTWNSPYTAGVDGYNYNDAQDYMANGDQDPANSYRFQSGPHGGYLTSTHKCRECHAVHRAAGKFKLLRSDSRFEACDWCHGTGAGSGYNIQMDNDDAYTTEYNVGHTMGFGISSGKWKAPDDTYPAFTPNYWMGGFSCFDCHSPHANPSRLLGYDDNGQAKGLAYYDESNNYGGTYFNGQTRYYSIINPGHGDDPVTYGTGLQCIDCHKKNLDRVTGEFRLNYSNTGLPTAIPLYQSGRWLLIKNPDREIAEISEVISYYRVSDNLGADFLGTPGTTETVQIVAGKEISDMIYAHTELINNEPTVTAGQLHQFSSSTAYPVNKIPIDWNTPIGIAKASDGSGFDRRAAVQYEPSHALLWNMSEFCTDCHDGNSGLHVVAAPLFSEDRVLRVQGSHLDNWKGSYDIAYSHDQNSRHCGRQMQFNPEDITVFGPHCRNCHKGSSSCGRCHSSSSGANGVPSRAIYPAAVSETAALRNASNNNWDRTPLGTWQVDSETEASVWVDPWPGIQGQTLYQVKKTSTGENNMIFNGRYDAVHTSSSSGPYPYDSFMFKNSRTAAWFKGWRTATGSVDMGERMITGNETPNGVIDASLTCSDDGFSWPHRTLGWKMLKDDLFGLDELGNVVSVGGIRTYRTNINEPTVKQYTSPVHDLDSVCLDCHNPTVWRATSASDHTDDPANSNDNHDDELLTRGLP